jgi:hypothetical protein
MCSGIQPVRTLWGVKRYMRYRVGTYWRSIAEFLWGVQAGIKGRGRGTYEPRKSYPPMSFMYYFGISILWWRRGGTNCFFDE